MAAHLMPERADREFDARRVQSWWEKHCIRTSRSVRLDLASEIEQPNFARVALPDVEVLVLAAAGTAV